MSRFPLSAHLGYLFTELPLVERFAAAAAAGFRVIEYPAPYVMPAVAFRALCDAHELTVAQIALPAAAPDDKGLAALAGHEKAFAEGLDRAVDYATAIGCRLIHPMAGIPATVSPGETQRAYLANLTRACAAAHAAGLGVIIEPIGLAGYHLAHPDQAIDAIEQVGAANLRLSFDAFHAFRAGVDVAAFVRRHGRLIAHVQIADAPGRHEPGTGEIDFASLFAALAETGYDGAIGLEYHPAGTTDGGLGWVDAFSEVLRHPA